MNRVPLNGCRALLLLAVALLSSCSQGPPPEQIVADFWAATLVGDEATVRATVLPDSFVATDFDTAKHADLFDSVVIGTVHVGGREATVNTRLQGVFYGEPEAVEFDTVVVLRRGRWRVDYGATASKMIGALLEPAFADFDQSVEREALGRHVGESVKEAVRDEAENQ